MRLRRQRLLRESRFPERTGILIHNKNKIKRIIKENLPAGVRVTYDFRDNMLTAKFNMVDSPQQRFALRRIADKIEDAVDIEDIELGRYGMSNSSYELFVLISS